MEDIASKEPPPLGTGRNLPKYDFSDLPIGVTMEFPLAEQKNVQNGLNRLRYPASHFFRLFSPEKRADLANFEYRSWTERDPASPKDLSKRRFFIRRTR